MANLVEWGPQIRRRFAGGLRTGAGRLCRFQTRSRRHDDDAMKGLAFIKDPDGYWIEILSATGLRDLILASTAPDPVVVG